ncbi:Uncharacterised protein [uncultured archaeon]|nr:Uncharacterised protein [uncultured archaeon]
MWCRTSCIDTHNSNIAINIINIIIATINKSVNFINTSCIEDAL